MVYTDGSCNGNPGPGGYAAIIKKGNRYYREIVGKISSSSNNRMELIAVIKGLSGVRPNSKVIVYSDSQYIVAALNEGRLDEWKSNGWQRIRTGKPVKNRDLWEVLCKTIKQRNLEVSFQKIAAHKGNYFNERVDFLARQAAKAA